jgi:hypothetical protein
MIEAIQRRIAACCGIRIYFSLEEVDPDAAPPLGHATTRWSVRSASGTVLDLELDHHYPIVGSGGPPGPGDFEVVPMGYLFTYPARVNGTFVADRFAYGSHVQASAAQVRRAPLTLSIEEGRLVAWKSDDDALVRSLAAYVELDPLGALVGAIGIGTNPLALTELGHDVHDGVMPGLVICFGDSTQPITNAPHTSTLLLRVGGRGHTIEADGRVLVDRGQLEAAILDDHGSS